MFVETQAQWGAALLFGASAQTSNDWMGWGVMLGLYGLLLLAVLVSRNDATAQSETGFRLPSGGWMLPVEETEQEATQHPWIWEARPSTLYWWQTLGILGVLASAAYGMGVVLFDQLQPGAANAQLFAPYAIVNAALLGLVLTFTKPETPSLHSQQGNREKIHRIDGWSDPSIRRVEPVLYEGKAPESLPSSQSYEWNPHKKLAYELALPQQHQAAVEVPAGPLMLTLLLSALLAPLLSIMLVGPMYLLQTFSAKWFMPLFCWLSGGLTLFMALLSYLALRHVPQQNTSQQRFGRFLFDFEQENLYLTAQEKTRSCHFDQCSALLVTSTPREHRNLLKGEEGDTTQPALQLLLYGATDSPEGLVLATFPLDGSVPPSQALGFAAMLSTSTGIALFATEEVPR